MSLMLTQYHKEADNTAITHYRFSNQTQFCSDKVSTLANTAAPDGKVNYTGPFLASFLIKV